MSQLVVVFVTNATGVWRVYSIANKVNVNEREKRNCEVETNCAKYLLILSTFDNWRCSKITNKGRM